MVGFTIFLAVTSGGQGAPPHDNGTSRAVNGLDQPEAARVGDALLLEEDLALAGLDEDDVSEWVEDELLAQLAMESGLENSRLSSLVQRRARQLYLRDAMLESVYAGIRFPDSAEVFDFLLGDSLLYRVERHYYHILVPHRSMADSLHTRLAWGENFQTTAERMSIGQKAGIGGDLGFMAAGELTALGISREDAVIIGLGRVFGSDRGWHILMVEETRALTDTARIVWSMADVLYQQRLTAARDSLLEVASTRRTVVTGASN